MENVTAHSVPTSITLSLSLSLSLYLSVPPSLSVFLSTSPSTSTSTSTPSLSLSRLTDLSYLLLTFIHLLIFSSDLYSPSHRFS